MTATKTIKITYKNYLTEFLKFTDALEETIKIHKLNKPLCITCDCKYIDDRLKRSWYSSTCLWIEQHTAYKYNESLFVLEIESTDSSLFVFCVNCTREQYENLCKGIEEDTKLKTV